jgi:hypothetical protein
MAMKNQKFRPINEITCSGRELQECVPLNVLWYRKPEKD